MKDIAVIGLGVLPALTCVGIAGYLAVTGKGSWGGFLLVACLIAPSHRRVD